MTLRANITTTYREVDINPPRATKNPQKKEVDHGGDESKVSSSTMMPASDTFTGGAVSQLEQKGNRPAKQNGKQTFDPLDVFRRASRQETSVKADYGLKMQAGSMVKEMATSKVSQKNESQTAQREGKPIVQESPNLPLPIAAPPLIRLAVPADNSAFDNGNASFSNIEIAPAIASMNKTGQPSSDSANGLTVSPLDDDAMQSVLMAALQFGQATEDNLQTDSSIRIDIAKHLQSEGIFGISANGRNLNALDFIRQKQFEYLMDQKPFTADELLLEAEKAINGTLNSDQSSSVSKSLLLAAESINAYRNHSVKLSEQAEIAARPVRVAHQEAKKVLRKL